MKIQIPTLTVLYKIWAILLIILLSTTFFTACGTTNAEKKGGSKSSKRDKKIEKMEDEEEAEEEEKAESNKEKESKTEGKNTAKDSEKETKKDEKKEERKVPSPEAIWADLMKGNQRFVAGKHTNVQFAAVRRELSKGQHPNVIILGCADSRVPPELVFDKNLGELFVVRAAGNVADSVALGSMEYAVEHLHASVIVVLGHESCGAVAAAVSNEEMPSKNLTAIVDRIRPAFDGEDSCPLGGKPAPECIMLNVKQSAKDVLLKSPILKKAVNEGKLTIISAVYKLESGEVARLD
jgi:carbonic anhydrase